MEKALEPIAALRAAADTARQARDALIPTWDKAVAALKRGARAAVDEGEPHMYATLFQPPPRNGGRNGKRTPHASPAPVPPPAAFPVSPAVPA